MSLGHRERVRVRVRPAKDPVVEVLCTDPLYPLLEDPGRSLSRRQHLCPVKADSTVGRCVRDEAAVLNIGQDGLAPWADIEGIAGHTWGRTVAAVDAEGADGRIPGIRQDHTVGTATGRVEFTLIRP